MARFDLMGTYDELARKVAAGSLSLSEAVESIPRSLRTEYTKMNIRELAAAKARLQIEDAVREAEYMSDWTQEWGQRARRVGLSTRQIEEISQGGTRLKELGCS